MILENNSSPTNYGTVNTVNVQSGATALVDNNGSIGTFTNNGTVTVNNYGTINEATNNGSMNLTNYDGGYVGTVNTSTGSTTGIYNSGTIDNVNMSVGNNTGIYNGGTVGNISIKNKETNEVSTVVPDEFILFSGGQLQTGKLIDFLQTAASAMHPVFAAMLNSGATPPKAIMLVTDPVTAIAEIYTNMIKFKYGLETAGGAFLLDMETDAKGTYHANVDAWQAAFGYNVIMDYIFDAVASTGIRRFPFSSGGENYVVWVWKGNYWNLGAGLEMGFYQEFPIDFPGDESHWFVNQDHKMMMSLTLDYRSPHSSPYKFSATIQDTRKTTPIINYHPTDPQWWATAFNPEYMGVNAKDLTATYGITFNSQVMYDDFHSAHHTTVGWSKWSKENLYAEFSF